MSEQVYTLVASNDTFGRYALDEPDGPEISSGRAIEIQLGGQWIAGAVEHGEEYVSRGLQHLGDKGPESRTFQGYYFIARNGGICGLCVGMKVRLS